MMKQFKRTKTKTAFYSSTWETTSQKCIMKLMICLILWLNILNNNCMVRSVSIDGAAYKNVVFEINNKVPVADCEGFLLNLEMSLKNASNQLFDALQQQVYFGEITIILPNDWPSNCLPNNDSYKSILTASGEQSDVTITLEHPIYQNSIWVEQIAGCGIQGKQMYASYLAFNRSDAGREFAKQWLRFRYGVFDEQGFDFDTVYPSCANTPEEFRENGNCDTDNKTGDHDEQNIAQNEPIKLCDDGTHNRYAPTKQNQICNRRSVFDVIWKHTDFKRVFDQANDEANIANHLIPNFVYKKRSKTRYVLILDETQDTMIRESWTFLRLAIRNWVVYDLPANTEVGVVLANDTGTSKQFDLTSLAIKENRNLIASFIPYTPGESQRQACLECAIRDAQHMLDKQTKSNGIASSVILIIAPGMDAKTNYLTVVGTAKQRNTRIATINYPDVIHRNPLDILAKETSALSYTLFESKQNADRTYLTTYFNLVNVLNDIMHTYYEGDRSDLPIEIHRKKLFDNTDDTSMSAYSAKRSSRLITGTFLLDESLGAPATFILYTHNSEYPLINSVILTSPSGVTYSDRSDERSIVKQMTIAAQINEIGTWSYTIDRFNGNPQPHFVQVKATPRKTAPEITVRAWYEPYRNENQLANLTHQPTNLIIIYVEVKRGDMPVNEALVEMTVTQPKAGCELSNKCDQTMRILDLGNGDPDITRGDGIYTRYFSSQSNVSVYQFDVQVNDNGNTAYSIPFGYNAQFNEYPNVKCCGSTVPHPSKQPLPSFQRILPTITFYVDNQNNNYDYIANVGRINNIHIESVNTTKVRLAWTSPDIGGFQPAKYDVKFAFNVRDLIDNYDTNALVWENDTPMAFPIGDHTSFTMNITPDMNLIGQTIYVAIRPYAQINDVYKAGAISNFVRVHIEEPLPPTTLPTNFYDGANMYESPYDIYAAGADVKDSIYFSTLLLVIICISAIGLVCFIVLCRFYWIRRRMLNGTKSPKDSMCDGNSKLDKQEKLDKYDSAITNNLIMTIANSNGIQQIQSPSPPTSMPYQLAPSHVDDPPYIVCPRDIPDPHTIGLPISASDDDFNRQSQYSVVQDWKNEWIDKYKSQDMQYRPYTIPTNTSYPRSDHILSPYESWTASQLLQGHEQRNSTDMCHVPDTDNMSIMQKSYMACDHQQIGDLESNASDKGLVNSMIDNGHMHSSPLPYMPYKPMTANTNLSFTHDQQIYSNDYVDNAQMKHNSRTYSTMIRSPERTKNPPNPSLQGSMSSVCGVNELKRKTRNITMV